MEECIKEIRELKGKMIKPNPQHKDFFISLNLTLSMSLRNVINSMKEVKGVLKKALAKENWKKVIKFQNNLDVQNLFFYGNALSRANKLC